MRKKTPSTPGSAAAKPDRDSKAAPKRLSKKEAAALLREENRTSLRTMLAKKKWVCCPIQCIGNVGTRYILVLVGEKDGYCKNITRLFAAACGYQIRERDGLGYAVLLWDAAGRVQADLRSITGTDISVNGY